MANANGWIKGEHYKGVYYGGEYYVPRFPSLIYGMRGSLLSWTRLAFLRVSSHRFYGFSFADPDETEDFNKDMCQHTPFGTGYAGSTTIAPFAIWREKKTNKKKG